MQFNEILNLKYIPNINWEKKTFRNLKMVQSWQIMGQIFIQSTLKHSSNYLSKREFLYQISFKRSRYVCSYIWTEPQFLPYWCVCYFESAWYVPSQFEHGQIFVAFYSTLQMNPRLGLIFPYKMYQCIHVNISLILYLYWCWI